jgi:phage terminase small subunit
MPALKNQRRERFARLLAAGKTAVAAYAEAGYSPSDSNGAWLARKEQISGRVAELSNQALEREQKIVAVAAERAAVTRESLMEMAAETYRRATEAGQHAAATAALKELGVLSGKRIERMERGGPGEFQWLENLSMEELHALADGELDIESYRQNETRSVN